MSISFVIQGTLILVNTWTIPSFFVFQPIFSSYLLLSDSGAIWHITDKTAFLFNAEVVGPNDKAPSILKKVQEDISAIEKLPAAKAESGAKIGLKSHERKTPLEFGNVGMDRHFMKTSGLAKKTKSKTLTTSGKGIPAPLHWADMSCGNLLKVSIISSSGVIMQREWNDVKMKFEKTLPQARIISIHRMQNMHLWEMYYLKRRKLELDYGNGCSNELALFHGTTPDTLDEIAEQNLDPRLAGGRVGTLLGKGAYFAIDAKYSDLYAKADSNGHKFMFLVKVLAGKTCTGKQEYMRPPPQDPSIKNSPLFDSCVDNVKSPRIYCIFHDSQYYPEHLIEYT